MAKKVKANLRMKLPGGGATPAPPVGAVLGQQGVNLMEFCKRFNAHTENRKGETVPVVVTVYEDKTFSFYLKTPPTADLIKKHASIDKGVSDHRSEAPKKAISWDDVKSIAETKMPDLNVADMETAQKVVAGTARSMGVEVTQE